MGGSGEDNIMKLFESYLNNLRPFVLIDLQFQFVCL